uniref:Uncharacterized protein MANES_08G112000 n=1 Tax=Rhizophora mucronata TaxID=61149 RepID=A0A2P2LPQ8_RHIMU
MWLYFVSFKFTLENGCFKRLIFVILYLVTSS